MEKSRRVRRRRVGACTIAVTVLAAVAVLDGQGQPAPAPAAAPAAPKDSLGRDTPRGTLLGFMDEARKGNDAAAVLYLNTNQRDKAAAELAHKLYVVLDSRLPARLNDLSDRPEGSLANPLKPGQDVVGTIPTGTGPLEILVERVNRGAAGQVWLFSRATLEEIPDVHAEVDRLSIDRFLPGFLTRPRIGGVRLSGWLALLLIVPLLYRLIGLAGVLFRPLFEFFRRRSMWVERSAVLWPGPIRLVALAVAIRWIVSALALRL